MIFKLLHTDKTCKARSGRLYTAHGEVETPVFMPVGTQATVKGVTPDAIHTLGAQIILGNTYHLYLRPGDELIGQAGGLHRFMAWDKPILTDSGGFQVFSLADLCKITDEGVRFQSHIDGSSHWFTPEKVIRIQKNLGSDIMMVLDECAPYPCEKEYALQAHKRTINWASQCLAFHNAADPVHGLHQFLFAIVQGGIYKEIREQSANMLADLNFDGYAIGGLAVGEPRESMIETAAFTADILPADKPRYLMGVGKPEDIIDAINAGVDMFDCVIPTRNGRNGTLYTRNGKINIRNQMHANDFSPIDSQCGCYTCTNFSRAYLRHLNYAGEILFYTLASIHNLKFYMDIIHEARSAIKNDNYAKWRRDFFQTYQNNNHTN